MLCLMYKKDEIITLSDIVEVFFFVPCQNIHLIHL